VARTGYPSIGVGALDPGSSTTAACDATVDS
jgi:hypothetical protein